MLRSLILTGVFLVTSNFLPNMPLGVPTLSAAHTQAPITAAKGAIQTLAAPHTAVVKAQTEDSVSTDSPEAGLAPDETEIFHRINAERTSRGLGALALNPLLVAVARGHSREMCDLNYFDHHSPTPNSVTPMDRYLKGLHDGGQETPRYALVGENIYYCSVSSETYNAAYAHQALMNSPGHRANILEPRFTQVGVGICRDARGQFWVTEMFLKDRE